MRLGVVLNEAAGGGRCGRAAADVLPRWAVEHALDIRRTQGPGDGERLAAELAHDGVDVVVSVGGDGTLFEVVNGLMTVASDARPAFTLLPLGTGNSFGRDFDLLDADATTRALASGRRRAVDVVRVVHREGEVHSINLCSVGFAAEVGDLTNRRFKGLGALGYIAAVLVQVTRLEARPYPFAVDGAPTDDGPLTLLSCSNSRYTGGEMMMAPTADATDGKVDVVRIGAMGRRRLLTCFPRLFRGTHPEMAEVTVAKASRVDFAPAPARPVMLDGEMRDLELVSLEVVPGALELLA